MTTKYILRTLTDKYENVTYVITIREHYMYGFVNEDLYFFNNKTEAESKLNFLISINK